MVLLFNHSDTDFEGMIQAFSSPKKRSADKPVNPKDRIAQMILERISVPRLQQVEVCFCFCSWSCTRQHCVTKLIWQDLDDTTRGAGGFGSTGGFGPASKKQKTASEVESEAKKE